MGLEFVSTSFFLIALICHSIEVDDSFLDEPSNQVGLMNDKKEVCLSLSSSALTLTNFNINDTDNKLAFPLFSSGVSLSGHCAKGSRSSAVLVATIKNKDENRKRQLKFYFETKNVFVKKTDELRWQLHRVVYVETYNGNAAEFESDNSSVIISAPLNQKYVCKDRQKIRMSSEGYSDVVLEISPDIDVQPYGPKSNFYLCERTRKRTLTESFQNKATVFSGVVLGLCSVGALIGQAFRRHYIPERKQMYDALGQ